MNNYFDKIYCINAVGDDDRWNRTIEEFKKASVSINDVEKISEVFPEDVSPLQSLTDVFINIIKDAKEKGYEKIAIFEDDFEVLDMDNFYKFTKDLEDYGKDWDLFHMGGLIIKNPTKKKNNSIANIRCKTYLNEYPNHLIRITNNLLEINGGTVQTTHSIAIRNTIFDEIINFSKLDKRLVTEREIKNFNIEKDKLGFKYNTNITSHDMLLHQIFQVDDKYNTYLAYPPVTKSICNISNFGGKKTDHGETLQPLFKELANLEPINKD